MRKSVKTLLKYILESKRKHSDIEEAFIDLINEYNSGFKFSELLSEYALLGLPGLVGIHLSYERTKADLSSVDKIKEASAGRYRELKSSGRIADYAKFKAKSGISPKKSREKLLKN